MFWNEIEVMVAQHSNVVNATELFPSKCLILSYVNFTKKKKNAGSCLPFYSTNSCLEAFIVG